MDPLPESLSAFQDLEPFAADDDLLELLRLRSKIVQALVPDCIGISVTMREHGVTLTLVADPVPVVALDAIQYVEDGPCERAVREARVVGAEHEDMLDETGWHLFAAATAETGVASTLSMPIVVDRVVRGGVNLYVRSRHCFDGHHDELAEIMGAWAEGAVVNADLTFSTRHEARRAPEILRRAAAVDVAVGLLAGRLGLSLEEARDRLVESAARAGSDLLAVAGLVSRLLGPREA